MQLVVLLLVGLLNQFLHVLVELWLEARRDRAPIHWAFSFVLHKFENTRNAEVMATGQLAWLNHQVQAHGTNTASHAASLRTVALALLIVFAFYHVSIDIVF